MATTTFQPYTGNGSNKDFNYSFPTFTASEVVVEVDGVVVDNFHIVSYSTTGTNTVRFDNGDGQGSNSSGTVNTDLCAADGTPKNNLEVIVRRDTNIDSAKASYTAGSSLKAADLTNNNTQILRALQEEQNTPTTTPRIRDQAITSAKIKNLTIVDEDISATAEIEVYKLKDGAANQVLVTQNDGTTVNWSSNVDLPGTLDVTGNVDFDSNLNVDGTTTLDGTTVDGVLDVNGSATIDNVQVNGNEIDTTSGNLTIDSAGGTTTVDDNLAVTGTLNVTQGITLQNATASLNGSQIVTETASQTLTNKTLTAPVINDLSGTAVVTSGTSTSDNKIYSAKRSDELYYRKGTADDIEESGVPWSGNDSTIATTAAIDARIVDIIDDVGGFVPLVDEGEIPQYHPEKENKDTADRVGTILSIGTLTQTYTPSNGTVTIQASDLTNHSVNATITDCGSTVLPSGFGVLVETKAQTDPQYANGPSFKFHRLTPKATEVTTVAGKATEVTTVHTNITNVNTVATNISNINAVAADQADIGAVAAKATEIGRLGTADAVADMAILGTADVVSDLNTLGTADVVADMNMLATSDVVADMNMLAVADVISDMNDLATSGNITAMSTCSTNIASINNASSNISSVNNFGDLYQVDGNDPTTDGGGNQLAEGDLYFNTSANRLKVYNGSSWVNGVEISGSGAVTTGNTFTGDNRYNDNVKALFGTGSDLEIYHDGANNSRLLNNTGALNIGTVASEIWFSKGTSEYMTRMITDGAVELYYDHSKKLETTSDGVTFIGQVNLSGLDTGFSNKSQPVIYRSGSSSGSYPFNTFGHLVFQARNDGSNRDIIFATGASASMKLTRVTSAGHFDLFGDNQQLRLGASQDLQIYHNGTNTYLDNNTGHLAIRTNVASDVGSNIYIQPHDNEDGIVVTHDGGVDLYYDNSKKFETTSGGVLATGDFDSTTGIFERTTGFTSQLKFTDSNETKLVHGSNGQVKLSFVGVGNAARGSIDGQSGFIRMITATGDTGVICRDNSSTDLRFDDSTKLETTSSGVTVTGSITASGGLTTNGDVQFNSGTTNMNILFDASQQSLEFDDNVKATFGFDRDLLIYHSGTNSILDNQLGHLITYIPASKGFRVQKQGGQEDILNAYADGAVQLYHNGGTPKFETTSAGVSVTGNIAVSGTVDGVDIAALNTTVGNITTDVVSDTSPQLGGNLDTNSFEIDLDDGHGVRFKNSSGTIRLQAYVSGGNGYLQNSEGDLLLETVGSGDDIILTSVDDIQLKPQGGENGIQVVGNSSVDLYYDNSYKAGTFASGFKLSTVTQQLLWPAFANTSASRSFGWIGEDGAYGKFELKCSNGNDETLDEVNLRVYSNNTTELLYDNSVKFKTTSTGFNSIDNLYFIRNSGTDQMLCIGTNNTTTARWSGTRQGIKIAGSNPVLYFHDTDNSYEAYLGGSGGGIYIGSSNNALVRIQTGTGNSTFNRWYFDGSGHFYPASNNSYDIGTTSNRVRNVYTNDLHLSNEGSSNDIDGSWGDWTIQEGESDLFLKNNRSGKKYKFNLTEVS